MMQINLVFAMKFYVRRLFYITNSYQIMITARIIITAPKEICKTEKLGYNL